MASPFTGPIVSPRNLFGSLLRRALEPESEDRQHMEVSAENISMYGGSGSFEESHHELFKVTTEVNIVHLAFSLLSGFIVVFGMFSAFIKEKLYVGEAILAIVIGLLISPHVAGWFEPSTWGTEHTADTITLEVTRIVIALSVFAVGVELPSRYMLRHWKSLAVLLGPIMLCGWLISAAFIYAIVPRLDFLSSLVVAACVTPTDPILAASVVGKGKFAQKHVPSHIRHLLQAESGCNDGAAFPFLYLALFLLLRGEVGVGESIGKWILLVILYQIILGIIMGAILGIAARKVMKFAKRNGLIDRESMVAMYVALAILSTALTTLAGSDDLLAAFACGTAFAWDDWFAQATEESNFSNVIDLLSNSLAFVYLGATMPVNAWSDPVLSLSVWRLVLLAIAILVLRRLPVMLLCQRLCPEIKTFREALFCGHFGPMGVGAIFIATLAAERLPTPTVPAENSLDVLSLSIQPIVYFIVLASVLVHGLTIPVFTGGKRMHSRVHSIGKSMSQGAEPSWLHRMKRVGDEITPSPIEREKDGRDGDEDDSLERAEKGGFVPTEGSGSGSNGDIADEVIRQQTAGGDNDDSVLREESDRTAKHEHHNPETEDREVWREGHKLVIERADSSDDVQVVDLPDRSTSSERRAPRVHVHGPHIQLPPQALEMGERIKIDESVAAAEAQHKLAEGGHKVENVLKKVGIQARRGSFGFERPAFLKADTLTEEEKEKRDAMCRGERRDVDRSGEEKTWIEGNLLIIEKEGGEDVEVVDISDFVKDPERLDHLKNAGRGRSVSTREVEHHRSGFLAQGIPGTLALIKGAKKALGIPNLQQPEVIAEQDEEDERGRARQADRGEGTSAAAKVTSEGSPSKASVKSSKGSAQSPKSPAQQVADEVRRQSAEEEARTSPPRDAAEAAAIADRPKPMRKDTLRKLLFKKNAGDKPVSATPEESADGAEDVDRGRPMSGAAGAPEPTRSPSPTRSVRSIRFADNLPVPRSRRDSLEGRSTARS